MGEVPLMDPFHETLKETECQKSKTASYRLYRIAPPGLPRVASQVRALSRVARREGHSLLSGVTPKGLRCPPNTSHCCPPTPRAWCARNVGRYALVHRPREPCQPLALRTHSSPRLPPTPNVPRAIIPSVAAGSHSLCFDGSGEGGGSQTCMWTAKHAIPTENPLPPPSQQFHTDPVTYLHRDVPALEGPHRTHTLTHLLPLPLEAPTLTVPVRRGPGPFSRTESPER